MSRPFVKQLEEKVINASVFEATSHVLELVFSGKDGSDVISQMAKGQMVVFEPSTNPNSKYLDWHATKVELIGLDMGFNSYMESEIFNKLRHRDMMFDSIYPNPILLRLMTSRLQLIGMHMVLPSALNAYTMYGGDGPEGHSRRGGSVENGACLAYLELKSTPVNTVWSAAATQIENKTYGVDPGFTSGAPNTYEFSRPPETLRENCYYTRYNPQQGSENSLIVKGVLGGRVGFRFSYHRDRTRVPTNAIEEEINEPWMVHFDPNNSTFQWYKAWNEPLSRPLIFFDEVVSASKNHSKPGYYSQAMHDAALDGLKYDREPPNDLCLLAVNGTLCQAGFGVTVPVTSPEVTFPEEENFEETKTTPDPSFSDSTVQFLLEQLCSVVRIRLRVTPLRAPYNSLHGTTSSMAS